VTPMLIHCQAVHEKAGTSPSLHAYESDDSASACIHFSAADSGTILLFGTLDSKLVGYGSGMFLLVGTLDSKHGYDSGTFLLLGTLDNKSVGSGSGMFLLLGVFEYEPDQDSGMSVLLYYEPAGYDSGTIQQDASVDDNDSGMVMLDNQIRRPVDGNDSGMVLLDVLAYRLVDDCGFLFQALYLPALQLQFDALHYSPVDYSELLCFQ
jgi:hypothetical protein